jgi:hypothetical protein
MNINLTTEYPLLGCYLIIYSERFAYSITIINKTLIPNEWGQLAGKISCVYLEDNSE